MQQLIMRVEKHLLLGKKKLVMRFLWWGVVCAFGWQQDVLLQCVANNAKTYNFKTCNNMARICFKRRCNKFVFTLWFIIIIVVIETSVRGVTKFVSFFFEKPSSTNEIRKYLSTVIHCSIACPWVKCLQTLLLSPIKPNGQAINFF